MGSINKLLADLDGKPIVKHVVEAALASSAGPVVVVTGHQAPDIRSVLSGCAVSIVFNADYSAGLSSSLKCGIRAVPDDCQGALVMLGDMPGVTSGDIDAIISLFAARAGSAIIVPTYAGKRGNPVLWPRAYFRELLELEGDTGAKALLRKHEGAVESIALVTSAVLTDIDSPDDLARARAASLAGPKPRP
jgi:molybdenum cofactor cytidylyltransferase